VVPVTVPTNSPLSALTSIDFSCTGGPVTSAGSANLSVLINTGVANTAGTGMPMLTITFDQCSHLNQPIFCPPGVPAGSNSLFFDGQGNAVFPGSSGSNVMVNPINIFPYNNPPPMFGTVSGNSVLWSNVPLDRQVTGNRRIRASNVFVNPNSLGIDPLANYPVFGTFTSSSADLDLSLPSSLQPGTNNFLLGVAAPASSSPFCQSPFVFTSGVTPFIVQRQVTVSGNTFDGVITLGGPGNGSFTSLSIFASGIATPGSCQGSSVFNPATGQANLQNIQYQGGDYWGWANMTSGLNFNVVNYGTGTMPSR